MPPALGSSTAEMLVGRKGYYSGAYDIDANSYWGLVKYFPQLASVRLGGPAVACL